jgi:septal ring factor EnvC (AmiA/AmiB activator)
MWTTCQYILHVATMAPAAGDDDAPAKLTYEELKVMLKEKEELDLQQHGARLRELEEQVERQRKDLHASQVKVSQMDDLIKKLEAANKEIANLKDGAGVGRLRSQGTVAIGPDGAPSKMAPPAPSKLAASTSAPFAAAKVETKDAAPATNGATPAATGGAVDATTLAAAIAEATSKHTAEVTTMKKKLDEQSNHGKRLEAENQSLQDELNRTKAALAAAAAGGAVGGPLDVNTSFISSSCRSY